MNALLDMLPREMLTFFAKISPQQWWMAANVVFCLFFLVGIYLAYYCARRALGHQKFKGRWYSAEQFQKLLQELYSGIREGRLPDSETMKVIDRHIYGKTSSFRKMSGTGWL